MNTNKPFNTWRCYALPLPLLFICFLLLLSACSPLRPAINAYFAGDAAKAREKIQHVKAPHELPAANYIEAMLNAAETNETIPLLAITTDLCVAEKEIKALPLKKIHRLARYGIRPGLVRQSNANLRNRIFNLMTSGSTVSELLYLMDSVACWPASTIDSLSREITNRTLDSTKSVIGLPDDKWTAPQLDWPSKEEIAEEPGRSFLALVPQASRGVTYVDATAIEKRLADKVEARNYPAYWEIKREIFDLFQVSHRYCEMDRFRTDHPLNYYALDCNYETAKDTLCLGELKPLLQFHRNNPHTALDWTICLQAIYLEVVDRTAANLSGEEAKQLQDIHLMLDLRSQINSCDPDLDPAAVLKDISYLAKAYPYHKVVYELAKELLLLLIDNGQLEAARNSLTTLQPLYADSAVCVPGYGFQVGKQAWFRYFNTHLTSFEDYVAKLGELQLPEPMLAWNTDDNHEHSMVSYGETDEAYFVRQPIKGGAAKVMRSQRKGGKWSAPTVVRQLSQGYRIRLHSMSGNGQQILLSIDGVLHQSYRPAIGRPWLKPDELPMGERFAGDAWLSPDDSLLLLTYYAEELSPSYEPQRQLAVARLDASGGYRQARLLEEPINVEAIDVFRPSMALGGRMLFLAADHDDSMGGTDMYSINMSQPAHWNSAKASQNLGLPMNSLRDDEGISYMSEYSGYAYFQRNNGCLASDDIYRYRMAPDIFPEALRLAGLVVDENGDPLGGGFMEFTPNFQLNVHALALSDNGTYVYTVADSTEVVRLFPEVPGYYSEQDATHYLSEVGKGEIIRDTFHLTSFDYIRENFKLEHSTFYHNTAQFDQANKAYPEITRLAKIAVRMGADLELIGHTDEVGSAADNKQLSLNRARSVRNYLVEKCGFDPARIRVEGKGATEPICPNDTEEGRRCNRRIEILFRMPDLAD